MRSKQPTIRPYINSQDDYNLRYSYTYYNFMYILAQYARKNYDNQRIHVLLARSSDFIYRPIAISQNSYRNNYMIVSFISFLINKIKKDTPKDDR